MMSNEEWKAYLNMLFALCLYAIRDMKCAGVDGNSCVYGFADIKKREDICEECKQVAQDFLDESNGCFNMLAEILGVEPMKLKAGLERYVSKHRKAIVL